MSAIRVTDDYIIDVDPYNYTAKVDMHKIYVDKQGNETPVYKTIGYYGDLKQAVRGCLKYDIRKSLGEGEKSLYEAVKLVNEASDRLDNLLNNIK